MSCRAMTYFIDALSGFKTFSEESNMKLEESEVLPPYVQRWQWVGYSALNASP